jgi:periplasmic glucans biosynthesis protein
MGWYQIDLPLGSGLGIPRPEWTILTTGRPNVTLADVPRSIFLTLTVALVLPCPGQTWEREEITFENIQSRARDLANRPYEPPDTQRLPEWMNQLTYDQYRDIRFNPNQALWREDGLPFRAMFFHPGYLFREPVLLNEFTENHKQRIRLAEAFFDYGPLISEHGELPPGAGFAGLRLHAPLNHPEVFDELIVFQGASYWRALGRNQRYGISARGLAVDTGLGGETPEIFPSFREFWLRKPSKDDTHALIHALMDSPSYTGAYEFKIHPGNDTFVDVHAVLFARQQVRRLGIAPMSSMFWFGENSRRRFDDFRPEVHDSDGLAIRMGSGERIWRPLANDTTTLDFSFFRMEQCDGFGLLQRDRTFQAYEDEEANYDQRPSLWIEPTSDWGAGQVMLMEIPTAHELSDNIVAMWEPATIPEPGDRIEFSYRQHWTMEADPSQAGGYVVATRTGVHEWQPEQRTVVVEFAGPTLENAGDEPLEAVIEAVGADRGKIRIQGVTVQKLKDGRRRVSFQIAPAGEGGTLAQVGPVELRCSLKQGGDYLTETWAYRVIP